MMEREVIYGLPAGIHARTAVELYCLAKKYSGTMTLEHEGVCSNLLSMLDIMRLNVACGDKVRLAIQSPEEATAMEAIVNYIQGGQL